MRKLAFVPLLILAACSSESADQAKEGESSAVAMKLNPGQWEMTSEVSNIAMAYKEVPVPDKAAMTSTFSTCITEEQANRPPAEAFAGGKGSESSCKYDNFYMSRGRMNASMMCQPGNTAISIDGTYSADTLDMTMEVATHKGTADDMKMTTKLTGRRTGPCAPEGDADTKA